jgi:hypothetical protein
MPQAIEPARKTEAGAINLIHLLFVYVSFVGGLIASFIVIAILPAAGQQSTFIGRATSEPIWLPEIIVGFWLGRVVFNRIPSKIALFAWIPPAVFLAFSAGNWQRTMSVYDSTWNTYFGSQCGGSECLYQLFLTAPFYTGIAYSLGALLECIGFKGAAVWRK